MLSNLIKVGKIIHQLANTNTTITFKRLAFAIQNIMAFKYFCFMNGLVKSGLQILGVNGLDSEFKSGDKFIELPIVYCLLLYKFILLLA